MKNQSKKEILKAVSDLLDQKDCVVRLQRELTPDDVARSEREFVLGSRVTFIIVATKPKETT